jgi:hypothetical protein
MSCCLCRCRYLHFAVAPPAPAPLCCGRNEGLLRLVVSSTRKAFDRNVRLNDGSRKVASKKATTKKSPPPASRLASHSLSSFLSDLRSLTHTRTASTHGAHHHHVDARQPVPPSSLPPGREREIFELLLSSPLVGAAETLALLGTCKEARSVGMAASWRAHLRKLARAALDAVALERAAALDAVALERANWAMERATALPEVWALVAKHRGVLGARRLMRVCKAARAGGAGVSTHPAGARGVPVYSGCRDSERRVATGSGDATVGAHACSRDRSP